MEDKKDLIREMAIHQGYVPKTCKLPGQMVMGLVNKGELPCNGCNVDRAECEGKPKKY